MRKLCLISLGAVLLGIMLGCNFGNANTQTSSSNFEGPPSPELMQYAEDLTLGWNARLSAKSWRTEILEQRPSGPVHVVAEAACPDRFHVTTSGSESQETYYIGSMMYQRKGAGKWTQRPLPVPYQGLGPCRVTPRAEDVDPARIRLVAEQLKDIALSKPIIKEVAGHKCREWTRTFESGKSTFQNTNCYDLKTHEVVQSTVGTTVTTNYWNYPVQIKPPL